MTYEPASPAPHAFVRVLIVDDMPQVRSDLRLLLELSARIQIVGEAADGRAAVALAEELRPEVVVTDLEMPGLDGCEAARKILARGLARKVILLSIHSGAELRQRAAEAGVRDFIHKGEPLERLIQAIIATQ